MTTLIVFSHLRWDHVYQRPQHLLTRLARTYPVLFIEEPVRDAAPAGFEQRHAQPGLHVLRPHTPLDAPGFHDDQLALLGPLLIGYLQARGIDDYAVWFYTPLALPLLECLGPRAVIYDCMDELSAFKGAPSQLRPRERALLRRADVVLTGGPSLHDARVAVRADAHCLPSAVDAAHFAPQGLTWHGAPAQAALHAMSGLGQPRLGFTGVIDERMDLELVDWLATHRPDWQLIMVGPVAKIDPASLPRHANLHWLGFQPYASLPYFLAQWDICIMPFALNEATRFISPTKTLEYLAADKPVVCTPVADVIRLYGEAVRIGSTPEQFAMHCESVLGRGTARTEEERRQARALVAESSWDRAAGRVSALIGNALDPRAAEVSRGRTPAAPPTHGPATLAPRRGARAPHAVRRLIVGADRADSGTVRIRG
ncbi:MAG: glycosyltransferase, partial [Candidatus Dactylopiibacterium sp.]|nr:glycosyltransferase [Candidatus Dactylopiibacterium sp.]